MKVACAKKIVITRAPGQAGQFQLALEEMGFETIVLSTIEIRPLAFSSEIQKNYRKLEDGGFEWLVFTSVNAVRCFYDFHKRFFQENFQIDRRTELPSSIKVAVQGEKTAHTVRELYQRQAQIVPKEFVAEALLEEFGAINLKSVNFLLALASKTRGLLKQGLQQKGANVSEIILYETLELQPAQQQIAAVRAQNPEDLVFTFFSPSAFHSSLRVFGDETAILKNANLVSIGPVTSSAIENAGFQVTLQPDNYSESGMLKAIEAKFLRS